MPKMPFSFPGGSQPELDYQDMADRNMAESYWQMEVVKFAHLHGWRVYHALPARRGERYLTAQLGDKGFPDCIMVKTFLNGPSYGKSIVLAVELKSTKGRATAEQLAWIDAFARTDGVVALVGYPKDRDSLFSLLSGAYDMIMAWKKNARLAGNPLG